MQLIKNLKKIILSTAFALLLTANVHAIPRGPCDPKPRDLCCEEPKPGPFGFSYPKDIGLSCPKDFYFSGEYILMQAKQEGLEYAMSDNNGATSLGSFTNGALTGGKIEGFSSNNTDWDWESGFRLNFGLYLNHDAWNLDAQWTWLRYTENTSTTVKGTGRIIPFWLVPTALLAEAEGRTPATEASAKWKMSYNVFDIILGKPYHVSRYVVFNPFFGIRAAWIDQDYLGRYGGTYTDAGGSNTSLGAEMTASNDFWGIGTRGGVKTEWFLGSGWALYGDASASVLFSKFDLDQDVSLHNNSYTLDQKFFTNTPNFELLLGVGWNYLFNKDQHRFGIRASYEFIHWWNINRMRRFYDGTLSAANDAVPHGDLSLNGVSFRVMFDF